ncbi:nuclear pore complex subunit Nro1-domain-containing protein [Spinellus fusiger]|nr:nuclear pore complex subunit Nro1-domain-containing protein [Spinellus fusiger]
MVLDKKRPRGLKQSAAEKAAKKSKVEDPTESTSAVPNENAPTVVLGKDVEEGDEVGEAAALYESAMEKLDTSPSEARALLCGTVHESDRILRNWEAETPLPLLFYLTYGSALFELGRMTESEEEEGFESYLEAAEERLQDGLDHYKDTSAENTVTLSRVKIALGRVWLAKAASDVEASAQEIPAFARHALAMFEECSGAAEMTTKAKVELAGSVYHHGDLYSAWTLRSPFTVWAETLLSSIVKETPEDTSALSQLGLCYLSTAHYWLDQADENSSEETPAAAEEEKNAYTAIVQAKTYFEQAHTLLHSTGQLQPHHCADLAEAYLHQATLVDTEEERDALYLKVVTLTQETKTLAETTDCGYELPEALESFLEEWEETA